MSTYIALERVAVQNANCIAGFTWGFPAITHFLGFIHNLSRKLQSKYKIQLAGCGVVSHQHQVHVYRPGMDYRFIQGKNPAATKKHARELHNDGKTPSIVEEGRMHFTASLIIECEGMISGGESGIKQLKNDLEKLCYQQKLAGGVINTIQSITIHSADTQDEKKKLNRRVKQILLPGFILMDRSDLLAEHFDQLKLEDKEVELVDAWLDFSALKYKAKPILSKNETSPTSETKAEWELEPKPGKGWLVPVMTGYKAISDVYPPGEVKNVRDTEVPVCFVEAIHSIGEWRGVHRLKDINDCLWRYHYDNQWYLCRQAKEAAIMEEDQPETTDIEAFLSTL